MGGTHVAGRPRPVLDDSCAQPLADQPQDSLVRDAVLKELPALAAAGLRAIDVFGRFGGEEFLLILPGTALDGARAAAERVCRSIGAARFAALSERPVTVTIGVAEHGKGEEVAALLARADRALYAGKAAGRNRVVTG